MRWTPPVDLSPREAKICQKHESHRRFFRFLRLHRHELFDDTFQEQLASAYSNQPRGTAPVAPALLSAVMLLQAYCRVSDEDAVDLAESDARWQMVLDCMGAEESPFSQATLVRFRHRLVESGLAVELLRRTVELARQSNDLSVKQASALRIALDSMPLQGAGKVEDTINLLGHALRLLVMVIAAGLGLTVDQVVRTADVRLLQAPSVKAALDLDWNQPEAENVALRAVAAQLDGVASWWRQQCSPGTSLQTVEQAQAVVDHLRAQNTEVNAQGQVQMRQGVAADRQISLSDPEMRHGRKSLTERIDGYKKYTALDLDTGLVLASGVLPANQGEGQGADKLQPEVERYGRVGELQIDRAFIGSRFTKQVDREGGDVVCRGLPGSHKGLFGRAHFTIDLSARTVRCPAGEQVELRDTGKAFFATSMCQACPQRSQCQKPEAKTGRVITVGDNEALHQKWRAAEKTREGRARLRQRTAVEHAQSRHGRLQGPQARYRGVKKNDFDVQRIAAVQNLLTWDRRERLAERARVPQAA